MLNMRDSRNGVIRERYGVEEDVVTTIEKGMHRLFGHVERMDGGRLMKHVYRASEQGQGELMTTKSRMS